MFERKLTVGPSEVLNGKIYNNGHLTESFNKVEKVGNILYLKLQPHFQLLGVEGEKERKREREKRERKKVRNKETLFFFLLLQN